MGDAALLCGGRPHRRRLMRLRRMSNVCIIAFDSVLHIALCDDKLGLDAIVPEEGRAIVTELEEAENPSPSIALVGQNWVDCALSSRNIRGPCMKKLGFDANGNKLGTKKATSGNAAHKASAAQAHNQAMKSARGAAIKAMKQIANANAPQTATQATAQAQRAANMAAKAAASANAAKKSAQEKVTKAKAAMERQQKKPTPRSKWEKWYKEKVHKVDVKLSADKKQIKARRNAQISVAKAKARKAGAHVSDLRL